jgi:glycine oxidase
MVVIGNGVVGMSVALALTDMEPAASIAVIGPADRPFGATPASGAMLGCFGEVTATSIGTAHGRAKLDLSIAARSLWPEWLDRLGLEMTATETVVLLNTHGSPQLDSANFAAIMRALSEAGQPYAEIAVENVEWIDPDPNARPLRALHIPNEGAIDSAALLRTLEAALARKGVTAIDEVATALHVHSGRVDGVRLGDSLVSAGAVVVAAGTGSGPLVASVPDLAHRVPMVLAGYGVSVLARTADGTIPPYVLRTPNRAFSCGLHVLPRSPGVVYLGATNDPTFEPLGEPSISEVNFLTTCALRQIRTDLNHAYLAAIQVGNRPLSIDGWPLVGPTSVDGLWIVTGTYRDGLHLAPLLAREVAARLTGRAGRVDIDRFRPEREPVCSLGRREVLDELVAHTLATGYEVPWVVDPDWADFIGRFSRESFDMLLDELGGAYIPPPEVLSMVHKSPQGKAARQRLRAYYEAVHAAWH